MNRTLCRHIHVLLISFLLVMKFSLCFQFYVHNLDSKYMRGLNPFRAPVGFIANMEGECYESV